MTTTDAFLEHYGVKGMRWGVRKEDPTGGRLHAGPTVDANLHSSTKTAAKQVAALMSSRYGFEITGVKDLKHTHPHEHEAGTIGFVQYTPGQKGGVIHARSENVGPKLAGAEKIGWFAEGTGNTRAFITHESAHACFHADQTVKVGLMGAKLVGSTSKPREKALKAAIKQAGKDGIPLIQVTSKISGYAQAAGKIQETEAELFSQYHWSPNPPPFVKTWGETLHRELGVDATPFREVVK